MKMAEVLSHLYPDSLRRVLLVRAPTPFPTIWTIVSPLIDERTRLKVYLYSGSEITKNLSNYLNDDAIPTYLGTFWVSFWSVKTVVQVALVILNHMNQIVIVVIPT